MKLKEHQAYNTQNGKVVYIANRIYNSNQYKYPACFIDINTGKATADRTIYREDGTNFFRKNEDIISENNEIKISLEQ